METRRLGRLEHQSSVLIYGAASLGGVDQETADASIELALDSGINHFDTAASYGDAELRLGHSMRSFRDRIFLASKTGDRSEEAAWASINRSLERLDTDHLDLIQIHAVCSMSDLDEVTADKGSLKAAIRAREEGLVHGIGITGHTHEAPAVAREGLRRFDFDSVLTPLNYRLWRVPGYADSFGQLVTDVQRTDAALMTIKMIAKRSWLGAQRYDTWYEPFDEQRYITAAVAWLLNGHPEITGLATAGETRLLGKVIQAEKERAHLSADEAAQVLDALPEGEYSSPFATASA